MHHHVDRVVVDPTEEELKALEFAREENREIERRAAFEGGCRSFGHTNTVEIERRYQDWKEANIPDEAA